MAFHTRAVWSSDAVTRRLPSGANATDRTAAAWPASSSSGSALFAFQTRAVPSAEAVATRRPSGEKAAWVTSSWWPRRIPDGVPVATSHRMAVRQPRR